MTESEREEYNRKTMAEWNEGRRLMAKWDLEARYGNALAEGYREVSLRIAKAMKADGFSNVEISELTKLPVEQVEAL